MIIKITTVKAAQYNHPQWWNKVSVTAVVVLVVVA